MCNISCFICAHVGLNFINNIGSSFFIFKEINSLVISVDDRRLRERHQNTGLK